jgi:hypothetical protein
MQACGGVNRFFLVWVILGVALDAAGLVAFWLAFNAIVP